MLHREVIRSGNRISTYERGDGWASVTCGRVVRPIFEEAQCSDGSWDPRVVPRDVEMQPGRDRDRLWVTALTTIAIDGERRPGLGAPPDGDERGPQWMASLQRADGSIAVDPRDTQVDMLDHAVATLALLHHVRRYPESPLREPAIQATRFLTSAARAEGGWSRQSSGQSELDTRTTAWAALALHFAAACRITKDQEQVARAVPGLRHFASDLGVEPENELHRFLVESLAGLSNLNSPPDLEELMIESQPIHDPELLFLYGAACVHLEGASNDGSRALAHRLNLVGLLQSESEDFCWIGDTRARGGALAAHALNLMSLQLHFNFYIDCH